VVLLGTSPRANAASRVHGDNSAFVRDAAINLEDVVGRGKDKKAVNRHLGAEAILCCG